MFAATTIEVGVGFFITLAALAMAYGIVSLAFVYAGLTLKDRLKGRDDRREDHEDRMRIRAESRDERREDREDRTEVRQDGRTARTEVRQDGRSERLEDRKSASVEKLDIRRGQ